MDNSNKLPIQTFLDHPHVRTTWIAFMTLWVFWGLTWFVRNAFGGDSSGGQRDIQSSGNATTVDPETGAATANPVHKNAAPLSAPAWSVGIFNRLNRAHDLLRDLTLMLLSVLTLNTFGRASLRGVMILAWIFVALAFVTFAIEATYEHRYLRLLYTLAFYGMGLAIVGLAYSKGF